MSSTTRTLIEAWSWEGSAASVHTKIRNNKVGPNSRRNTINLVGLFFLRNLDFAEFYVPDQVAPIK